MEQYTFRADNKDPIYKKLLKLPTAYYILKRNGDAYTIESHIGTAKVQNAIDLNLRKKGDKIVLCEKNLPLKAKKGNEEKDLIIEQEATIGGSRDNIIEELRSYEVRTASGKITGVIGSYYLKLIPNKWELNFINFYGENDPVLEKIKKEKGELYFTIKDNDIDCSKTIYISDKNGRPITVYGDNQYTLNTCDPLTISDISTIIDSLEPKFTLQKGEELRDNTYKANIALDDKVIATLPKVGYYMLDDQLVIRNHVTQETVVIPSDFHYLKVIKFGDNDYKLTFCNVLGNEFFEYKKYDPQYSNVPDEYKFISLSCTKKEYNPSLGELLSHRPSFFIAEGSLELGPDLDKHVAEVFELTPAGKGRKMAILIDEFGYFNQDGMFMHCNYHTGSKYQIYDPAEIDKEYKITDADNEFYLTKYNDMILHTIPELIAS
ncbi:hypothetical protein [Wolbachia endosymbiont of Ctenocephalides felis wCfeJ]|uniref:hypothetical protein n=1 Tax=Wolbachia endosymbiont of Ctenocephalides felis wCfeJ TaxID=2732594 RepID=UPI0014459FE6|nr:hypothetical protein [Wolbachia endosymbiont of Ctenocephalides felis wCfeJ]WCR58319.1 MAG: hypothetical protein PG980_000791 [Wolbachia endosymbiont of Ctenocephalides felis wCfeJ]